MISWWLNRKLDAFQAHYDYDASYLKEILALGVGVLTPFHRATSLGSFRRGVCRPAWHAAKLVSLRREDCGPCLQLCAKMAAEDGVSPETIAAVLSGHHEALPEEVSLAVRFVEAVQARDPAIDDLRAQLLPLIGAEGIVSLAYAMLSARLYPDLKYALGHGRACSKVSLDGEVLWTPAATAAG